MASQVPTETRRSRLLELVRQRGFVTLPDLADELQVVESTIRRDLDVLEANGSAKRTYGGAFYTGPSPQLPHFDRRQATQLEQKRQIALTAATLIDEGDTTLLDGGSTTYELARLLVDRALQVVPNSLPVANLFTASDRADLVLISKFGHTSLALLCRLSEVDALVVDRGITDPWRERLVAAGLRLMVAGVENPS